MCGIKPSVDAPTANISAQGPRGTISGPSEPKAKSGCNCCGTPKTKGESNYGYELGPVGGSHNANISGKPKSHAIDMGGDGGFSNNAFDGPEVRVHKDVDVKATAPGVKGPEFEVPRLSGDTSIHGPSLQGPGISGKPKSHTIDMGGGAEFSGGIDSDASGTHIPYIVGVS